MMPTMTSAFELVEDLVKDATQSPRMRQHRNIHASFEDPCQRVLNAIGTGSYIRPHRHTLDPKSETLLALRGLFALVTFEDDGAIHEVIRFGTERFLSSGAVGVEIPSNRWHTIIALEPGSVLLEVKAGPFSPETAKEPAVWAPEEGAIGAVEYSQLLQAIVRQS